MQKHKTYKTTISNAPKFTFKFAVVIEDEKGEVIHTFKEKKDAEEFLKALKHYNT